MVALSGIELAGVIVGALAALFAGWAALSAKRAAEASAGQTQFLARSRRMEDVRRLHDEVCALGEVKMQRDGTREIAKMLRAQRRVEAALAVAEQHAPFPHCLAAARWIIEQWDVGRDFQDAVTGALIEIEHELAALGRREPIV